MRIDCYSDVVYDRLSRVSRVSAQTVCRQLLPPPLTPAQTHWTAALNKRSIEKESATHSSLKLVLMFASGTENSTHTRTHTQKTDQVTQSSEKRAQKKVPMK